MRNNFIYSKFLKTDFSTHKCVDSNNAMLYNLKRYNLTKT